MMQRSRRRHKHAASPAEHLSSYKSMSARRTGWVGGHIKTSDWSKILNISNEEFQSASWPLLTSPGITWPDQLGEKSSYHKSFVFHPVPMQRWISPADAKKLKFPPFPSCKIHSLIVLVFLIAVKRGRLPFFSYTNGQCLVESFLFFRERERYLCD